MSQGTSTSSSFLQQAPLRTSVTIVIPEDERKGEVENQASHSQEGWSQWRPSQQVMRALSFEDLPPLEDMSPPVLTRQVGCYHSSGYHRSSGENTNN